tara:strand:- start:2013 stop:3350 length:1338 start_codon:yes stop_codon:yes gene_type:complete
MANQLEVIVYQIDGNPLTEPILISFLTSDIFIKESTISGTPEIQSALVYYSNASNLLQNQTFYVSETIDNLLASANTNGTTQIQATVLQIDGTPQIPSGVKYCFPANAISIWQTIDGLMQVNSTIQFKNKKYGVSESEVTLIAAANAGGGGGGGGTNPTEYVAPINIGNTFADSNIYNLLNEQIKTFTNSIGNYGLFIDFVNFTTKIGDIEGFNKVSYLNIDNTAQVISTIYTANSGTGENGLKLDFANNEYKIGEFIGDHKTYLNIQGINNFIFTVADDVENGLRLDFTNGNFVLGDYATENYYLAMNTSALAFIKDADYEGILINTAQRFYKFGNITSANQTFLFIDDGNAFVNFNYLNNPTGLQFDYASRKYNFGGFNDNLTYIEIDDGGQYMNFRNAAGKYNFGDMPSYADNAAALAAGLVVGDLYRGSGLGFDDFLHIVH